MGGAFLIKSLSPSKEKASLDKYYGINQKNQLAIVIDNKVIVYDEYYSASSREYTNNIEEVLITENNIEEIEKLIQEEKQKKKDINLMEAVVPAYLALSISRLISSIFKFITHEIEIALIRLFSSICFFGAAYFTGIKTFIKIRKIGNAKLNFLNEELANEKEKLNELNKDKTNDVLYAPEGEKIVDRSIQIDILKNRLRDINFYIDHKHKIIKLYKKGLLENELFEACASRDTINFIIELVKNDLSTENKSKKNKVKVKANDIEYGNI